MLLFIPIVIIKFCIITIYFLSLRKIIFNYENLSYFLESKFYVDINLNKYFKKLKIVQIIVIILYIINWSLILSLIILNVNIFNQSKSIDIKVFWVLLPLFIIIVMSQATIYLVWKIHKLKNKYKMFLTVNNKETCESYFLDIKNINLTNEKFWIINKYIEDTKIKIYYISEYEKLIPIIFPNYKKLKKILLKKYKLFDDKLLYIDSILATESLKLKIKSEYLDREQISYLRFLIINNIIKDF